jgi:plastocyanin
MVSGKGVRVGVVAVVVVAACFSEKSDGITEPAPAYVSCAANAPSPPASARVVRIRDFAFDAATVSATAGTTVWWINCENPGVPSHTTTSDSGIWDSPLLAPGDTYSRTFQAAGSFPYHCKPHPNMLGTVNIG